MQDTKRLNEDTNNAFFFWSDIVYLIKLNGGLYSF